MIFEKPSFSLFPLVAKFKWRKSPSIWYAFPTGWRTIRHFIARNYIAEDTWEQTGFMVTSDYTFTWLFIQIDFTLRIEQRSESIVEVKTVKMPRDMTEPTPHIEGRTVAAWAAQAGPCYTLGKCIDCNKIVDSNTLFTVCDGCWAGANYQNAREGVNNLFGTDITLQ